MHTQIESIFELNSWCMHTQIHTYAMYEFLCICKTWISAYGIVLFSQCMKSKNSTNKSECFFWFLSFSCMNLRMHAIIVLLIHDYASHAWLIWNCVCVQYFYYTYVHACIYCIHFVYTYIIYIHNANTLYTYIQTNIYIYIYIHYIHT